MGKKNLTWNPKLKSIRPHLNEKIVGHISEPKVKELDNQNGQMILGWTSGLCFIFGPKVKELHHHSRMK